jgi:hypothetical protein
LGIKVRILISNDLQIMAQFGDSNPTGAADAFMTPFVVVSHDEFTVVTA